MGRRAAGVPPTDGHWAPEHLVLERHVLSHAGRLHVARGSDGEVLTHSPLNDMAAVEHRHPAWARGPFGRIDPELPLPSAPGVFALAQAGTVRYVGSHQNIARLFGRRHGLGEITRQDAQRARWEERCRLNRIIVAEARASRPVDLYLLVTEDRRSLFRPSGPSRGAEAAAIADQLARGLRDARGSWHLPT